MFLVTFSAAIVKSGIIESVYIKDITIMSIVLLYLILPYIHYFQKPFLWSLKWFQMTDIGTDYASPVGQDEYFIQ